MTAFTIIVVPTVIFITPFFAVINIIAWVAIQAGSMSNIVLELSIDLFGVCI